MNEIKPKPKPRLSGPTAPAKTSQKKRSKSLGGPALEHLRNNNNNNNNDHTFELTPRKKARRSLLPGKSILKSRPTLTGLERTTSDNTLTSTLNLITTQLPSRATSTGPELPPPHQSNEPTQTLPLQSNQQAPDENNLPDNSSDMDLSDDQVLNRISLGSNTTNILRRVSFAAKAHVRTFGSPIVDPDCSIASSSASNAPNQPLDPSSFKNGGAPEGDQTADDMSMDNSLSTPQLNNLIPPPNAHQLAPNSQPPQALDSSKSGTRDPIKLQKSSRLSTAIAGFSAYDDDEDDDDDDGENDHQRNAVHEKGKSSQDPINQSNLPQPALPKGPQAVQSSSASETQLHHKDNATQDMDITTPFQPIPTNIIHPPPPQKPTDPAVPRPLNPAIQSGIPRLQMSSDHQRRSGSTKSSRLSTALPEYLRRGDPLADETENLDDDNLQQPIQPSIPSIKPKLVPNHPPVKNVSRLSVAFPEYMGEDDDDDDDDDAQEVAPHQPVSLATFHPPAAIEPVPIAKNHSTRAQDREPLAQESNNIQNKTGKKPSRITDFLGVSGENRDDDDDDEDDGDGEVGSGRPRDGSAQPPVQSSSSHPIPNVTQNNNIRKETSHPAPNVANKPSRLTELFTDLGDRFDDTQPVNDQGSGQALEVSSEPAQKKHRSRISEFFQEDVSEEIDEGNLALIDFEDEAGRRPKESQRTMSLSGLQSTQENEDLMNISFEYRTHVGTSPQSRISTSNPGGEMPDSQSTFRADSFPARLSVGPRVSAMRPFVHHQLVSSASPSRRLSGSLSGSPRKSRLSFASPRRSSTAPVAKDPASRDLQADSRGSLPPGALSVVPAGDPGAPPPPLAPGGLHLVAPPAPSTSTYHQPPPPTPPASISLNEFFEQAEIRFISLSQPRVRNHHDHQLPLNNAAPPSSASFADQICAGMVKIPRLRLLESSSRSLKQKTELLDHSTKEHESAIERHSWRYKLLKDWVDLQDRKREIERKTPAGLAAASNKELEPLAGLVNQLRLKKNWVEQMAKQDALRFEIQMWSAYREQLGVRTAQLHQDLEVMRRVDSVVKPATESLRDRRRVLTESIQARKQKMAEIESCDQAVLKELKEEAKDLAAETEANRRALAESEFERNLWVNKFAELEIEKVDHLHRIEAIKLDPSQNQKLTVQELVRLKNEFGILQSLMGWELVRYDETSMEFCLLERIQVVFYLEPSGPNQDHLNVGRIELEWIPPPTHTLSSACLVEKDHQLFVSRIQAFFFGHLKAYYLGKRLSGRVKEYVQEISSIWNHAQDLTSEIVGVSGRFRTTIRVEEASRGGQKAGEKMGVTVVLRAPRKRTAVDVLFSFDGQEILDWKTHPAVTHLTCSVSCVFGAADCLNLGYIIAEALDKGFRGALLDGCLDALSSLDA